MRLEGMTRTEQKHAGKKRRPLTAESALAFHGVHSAN